MERLKDRFAFARDAEVAIEIDPTSLPPDRRDALGRMGVTRISLGVQDLEPAVQKAIGREQSYEETRGLRRCGAGTGRWLAQSRSDLRPAAADRRKASRGRRAARLTSRPTASRFLATPMSLDEAPSGADPARMLCPVPVERFGSVGAIHRVLTAGGRLCRGRPRSLRAACRRHGQGRDERPAEAQFPGLYDRRGARPDRVRRKLRSARLPQGYVQNAPTAAAYAKEIEADRLATVRGVALTADDRLRRDVIERVMCDLEVDLDRAGRTARRRSRAVEGRGIRGNASICGGWPRILGRPAH